MGLNFGSQTLVSENYRSQKCSTLRKKYVQKETELKPTSNKLKL